MKEHETTGAWALLLAALTVLSKWDMFQKAGEKFLTRWVDGLPFRRLGRRLSDEQLERVLSHEREELETLILLQQAEWKADRVTLVEYDCPDSAPTLATCIFEAREPRMPSMKQQLQRTPLEPEVWAEVLRVHSLPSRSLYVPDVRKLEIPSLRTQLLRSGVCSAYYQSMPATEGQCGAMLCISWATPTPLNEVDLAGLHWSARALASVLRAVWHHQGAAA